MSAEKILVMCKKCGAKNRLNPVVGNKTVRCGKCGEPLPLRLNESMSPAIDKIKKAAAIVKMEFEDYTHYKVCSITVDLIEDTIHIKWKVETNIDDLWRLPQRWPIEYYFTIKMLLGVYNSGAPLLQDFAISFFERYLNFAPEDEGENFRDLCLLSIKADRKKLHDINEQFNKEDLLKITGPKRVEAMEAFQSSVRKAATVRQNYKGTLVNKSSLIYKAVKPIDLSPDKEITKEEPVEKLYETQTESSKEEKKMAAMRLIEQNIEKLAGLDTPYLRIFAHKYGLGNEERRQNLRELLEAKKIKLPEKVVLRLIQKELDEIEYERFVKKIRAEETLSLNHYIRRYLELFNNIEEHAENFYRFLVENSIIIEDVSMNVERLKEIIRKIRKSIELELFEKRLMGDIGDDSEVTESSGIIEGEEISISQVNPKSETYSFLKQTLLPAKNGGVPGVMRLYIDNFMDTRTNRAMLLFFMKEEHLVSDPKQLDVPKEIRKIQYEEIPEAIEDEPENFDSFSSQEILEGLDEFHFIKKLHLMRYIFERMGFNARIVDKENENSGLIFLDNQEDEKLIVKYYHTNDEVSIEGVKVIPELIDKYNTNYGIVVAASNFETEAIEFALENDIELIDKSKIMRLIGNVL